MNMNFQKVWKRYKECCETRTGVHLGLQLVSYRTFCRYWLELLPHIVTGKPRSDLCWTCQQNSVAIMKMANNTDDEKEQVCYQPPHSIHLLGIIQVISAAKTHLDVVKQERSLYRDACKSSRENLKSTFTTADGTLQPPGPTSITPPRSVKTTVHYSFDMAQQVIAN